MITLKIRKETSGGRIDKYLFRYLDKAPRSFVYKMMRKKNIELNGKKIAGSEILKENDLIRIYFSDETLSKFHTEGAPVFEEVPGQMPDTEALKSLILFEDENLIALNKPCGMLSQKAKKEDLSINELLSAYLLSQSFCEPGFIPGISNRLDRNTSGIILAGKNPAAGRLLNKAIKEKQLSKKYWTVVKGNVKEERLIEGWLVKDPDKNRVQIFSSPEKVADSDRKSELVQIKTAYRSLANGTEACLLEVDLITGKSHQIRAHLASEGHPVIGDTKYGDQSFNYRFRMQYGLKAQLLHAKKIEFHDMEGFLAYLNGKTIEAELPLQFKKILEGEKLWLPGEAED